MIQKTEYEIMKTWKNINKVTVSICCATFNHEKFIANAIDGFLMQECDYSFEILIHDDYSTDNTAIIIQEYEKKYPNIVKPIYQSENQYSKGIKPDFIFNFKRAKGKYIARCEGDDYWSDKNKLKKQIDFMETHPEYTICFHKAAVVNELSNRAVAYHPNLDMDSDLNMIDLIKGNAISTASVVYRYDKTIVLPENFHSFKLGDWPMNMIYASKGKVKYFADVMSVYRIHSNGVWSSAKESQNNMYTLYMLEEMNKYFHYKFDKHFTKVILKQIYQQVKFYIKENKIKKAFLLYNLTLNKHYKINIVFRLKLLLKLYKALFFKR